MPETGQKLPQRRQFRVSALPPKAAAAVAGRRGGQERPPAPQQVRVALMESCQRDVPNFRLLQWAVQALSASVPASSLIH